MVNGPCASSFRGGRRFDRDLPATGGQALQVNLTLRANLPPFGHLGQRGDPNGQFQSPQQAANRLSNAGAHSRPTLRMPGNQAQEFAGLIS